MTDLLHQRIEVKFLEQREQGTVKGLASPFYGEPDRQGDIVQPGAFTKSLKAPEHIVMLWAHDQSAPVGKWTSLQETDAGLEVEGRLNLSTASGREAFEHLKAGDVTGLSIGYRVPNGGYQRLPKGGRLLKSVELMEISFVAVPASPVARVTEVKSFTSAGELKSALRSLGLSKTAAERVTRGGWPALAGESQENSITTHLRGLRAAARAIIEA
ncbi:HK97 family phage prohead protease [Tropicimonas isoalkanivorans]|uniref:Prohead serine protease domain-containing protein n=1 Tax=Tropicimonas isoalkanivorans TaxID=441112 RepID=A0A1I1LXD0_9RHOB|nr:HK97 family phage prohead protease [Tropicimonas isoalkanivorans]SFC77774.1 hypothetical protein SAMN04488094_10962 [Tropicimonas isoalkanivorans]